MQLKSIKTCRVNPGDSLEELLDEYVVDLQERTIVAVTSKIVGLCEQRYVKKDSVDKYELIKQESDFILKTEDNPYNLYLTIKDGMLIPSAGIDESNVEDGYVLYPVDVWQSAANIWNYLSNKYELKNLGVIITDSRISIMRRGVTGISLGWCGVAPLHSYIDSLDLYQQPFKVTQMNIVDALATAAAFMMGEGNEQTPIAIITDSPHVKFLQRPPLKEERDSLKISLEEDLYGPMCSSALWESRAE